MKKVNGCFGRYGERIGCTIFCQDEDSCKKCYFNFFKKYFNPNTNRLNYQRLNELIKEFMEKNRLQFKDERNIYKTNRK